MAGKFFEPIRKILNDIISLDVDQIALEIARTETFKKLVISLNTEGLPTSQLFELGEDSEADIKEEEEGNTGQDEKGGGRTIPMIGSMIAMIDVIAANASNTKNSAPKIAPPFMPINAAGKVWKISPGPDPGSRSLANTRGKIIRPARSATSVSAPAIINADLVRETSFGTYDP